MADPQGQQDGFVMKFDPNDNLEFCTYFGVSNSDDYGYNLVYDINTLGLYVIGEVEKNGIFTKSYNNGYLKSSSIGSKRDAFVMRISHSTGSAQPLQLDWATYFGSGGNEFPLSYLGWSHLNIAVDDNSNLFIVGNTAANSAGTPDTDYDYPAQLPLNAFFAVDWQDAQPNTFGTSDAFIAAFNNSSELLYTTHFAGDRDEDEVMGLAVSGNRLYFTGAASSVNATLANTEYCFPTKNYDQVNTTDWFDDEGSSNISNTPLGYISMFNINNINIPDQYVEVQDTEHSAIQVYPNPANDLLVVKSMCTIEYLRIYNGLGQCVYISELYAKSSKLDVSHFSKGIHTISCETKHGMLSTTFVVQ